MDSPKYKDWSVVSTIGQGTYGKVYLVERKTEFFSEQAALKVITFNENDYSDGLSEDFTKDEVASFQQECIQHMIDQAITETRMGIQLSKECKNIIRYRDYQIQRNKDNSKVQLMMLMDLVKPLTDYFSSGIIREKEIIKLGIDICNALIHLENHGIIHRDIKPGNLFVDDFGNYVLGDLGGAIFENENGNDGGISRVGTLNYIAPEVYVRGTYSHSADIYCLGLVLFRFLNNGALPFIDKSAPLTPSTIKEAVERRLSGEIPTLSIRNKWLSLCVAKAIQPSQEKRYHCAEELKHDLEIAYGQSKNTKYSLRNIGQTLPHDNSSKTIFSKLNRTMVLYSAEFTLAPSEEHQRVQLNLLARLSLNDFVKLSDADLAHIVETSIFVLSDRAYQGNPSAKSHLSKIREITKPRVTTSMEKYRSMILRACNLLIENSLYSKSNSENEMNDYVRDILFAQGNVVQDQTRQGKSSSGKSAGEIDIKITYSDCEPALIEALKTSSLDDDNMKDHIKRLMVNYDPRGVYSHFLLIYYFGQSLDEFTNKLGAWLNTCYVSQISFDNIYKQRHSANIAEINVSCKRDGSQEELAIIIMGINK